MPAPRSVIAGGTGLLGGHLARTLAARGHDVVVLTRQPVEGRSDRPLPPSGGTSVSPGGAEPARGGTVRTAAWRPDGTAGAWASALDGADAVINLAGASLAARRWSRAQKAMLRDSRFDATRSLVAATRGAAKPPRLFVSASAVGYYGNRGDETLTESSSPGTDFLAELCVEWERLAVAAAGPATRVVVVRTGVVLDPTGGALPRMLLPFRLFAGGPLGSGRQYLSWIHHLDWVALVVWILDQAAVEGPINATAPEPVTNAQFSRALGAVLRRPSWLPAPAFALRALLGEMGDALLLAGQRVLPDRARALGFRFTFDTVEAALRDVLMRR